MLTKIADSVSGGRGGSEKMGAAALSWCVVSLGAALWLTVSLIVAFPDKWISFDVNGILASFLTGARHPISVFLLLSVDIVIALFLLDDRRMWSGLSAGPRRLGATVGGLMLFAALAVLWPTNDPTIVESHALAVGSGALLCLGLVRAMSYASPQEAVEIGQVGTRNRVRRSSGGSRR